MSQAATLDPEMARELRKGFTQPAQEVAHTLGSLSQIALRQDVGSIARKAQLAREKLRKPEFSLLLAGHFNAGKTTLLNALLGAIARELQMPMDILPTTAVLSRFSYGPEISVTAIHHDGTRVDWTIEEYRNEARLYGNTGHEAPVSAKLQPVARFEISLPLPLLEAGLVVIDAPGIGEDPARTSLAMAGIKTADSAILVTRSDVPAGNQELNALEQILPEASKVFIVVNRFGSMSDAERTRNYLEGRLRPLRSAPDGERLDDQVMIANCRQGLEAALAGDVHARTASGLPELERRLSAFLLNGAGAAKLDAGQRAIVRVHQDMLNALGEMIAACDADTEQARRGIDAARKGIEQLAEQAAKLKATLAGFRSDIERDAFASLERCSRSIVMKLPGALAQTPIPSLSTKLGQVAALATRRPAHEAGALIEAFVTDEMKDWAEQGLKRDLQRTIDLYAERIGQIMETSNRVLSEINLSLQIAFEGGAPASSVSAMDRVASGLAGFLLLGPAGFVLASGGWRSLVGLIVGAVSTKVLLMVVAVTIPALLGGPIVAALALALTFGGAVVGGVMGIEERVKKKAVEAATPLLLAIPTNEEVRTAVSRAIDQAFDEPAADLITGFDAMVAAESERLDNLARLNESTASAKQARRASALAAREEIDALVSGNTAALEAEVADA